MSENSGKLLAYASVQMAAEASFGLASSQPGQTFSGAFDSPEQLALLTTGNNRSSRFTPAQAAEFAQIWEVVEHKSNTTTGFSGTLFRVRTGESSAPVDPSLLSKYGLTPGQLVLSFRSTEFLDDNARDNKATNGEFGVRFQFLPIPISPGTLRPPA